MFATTTALPESNEHAQGDELKRMKKVRIYFLIDEKKRGGEGGGRDGRVGGWGRRVERGVGG